MPPKLPWFPPGIFRQRRYADSLAPERSHARLEVEGELNGVGNGFTDFTPDLRSPLDITYGISSTGPLALVASTGRMRFSLANGETSSLGLLGYYTPGHVNCRPGFRLGIRVRFRYLVNGTTYYKFFGWLDEVNPIAGKYRERRVECTALDWMNEAASANPIIAIQSSRLSNDVLSVVQASVARQPYSTTFDTGLSTFPYALDSLDNESGSALSEFNRICVSEGNGKLFIRGNTTGGGELRYLNRTAQFAFTAVASFNETMHGLEITQARSQIRNKVKATTHPRRVGSVTTDVLFSDQAKPFVGAGATVVLSGSYTDPSTPSDRIGGADMTPPVATTDYTMNTASDGSGTNLTANFTVSALYGGNSLEHTITNLSASGGYITKRQARGRTIKDLDPVDTVVSDPLSIAAYGETRFFYDMPYQDDQGVAATMGNYVLAVWGTPRANEATVVWRPRSDADKQTAMSIEPGSVINLQETMTGINGPFFVNQVDLHAEEGDILEFRWLCQLAVSQPFVAARTQSTQGSDNTNHTLSMPSGVVSGNLLIAAFSVDCQPAFAAPVVTWPAGWTRFAAQSYQLTGATVGYCELAYRQADGTEGASITVTTDSAQQSTHLCYRILGAANPATKPPVAASTTNTIVGSTLIDPPRLTVGDGVNNYLWLAIVSIYDSWVNPFVGFKSIPNNYSNPLFQAGTVGNVSVGGAERSYRTDSEDPGAFRAAATDGTEASVFGSFTVAVYPA